MLGIRIVTTFAFGAFVYSAAPFASPAFADAPSFNCAKTDSRAEELICGDRELALMDVEATRLFKLVRDVSSRPDEQKKALNDDRNRWLRTRDECWIAEDLRNCIITSYAVRIHSLREKHAEARSNDAKGITKGPFDFRCKNLDAPLKATFIGSNPPVSAVQMQETFHIGIGSGMRYVERSHRGNLFFWTAGKDAFLKMPNGVSYDCTVQAAK
jgi:uncharacterized protein